MQGRFDNALYKWPLLPRGVLPVAIPRSFSREELMWSTIVPTTPLYTRQERAVVRQYINNSLLDSREEAEAKIKKASKFAVVTDESLSQPYESANLWWTTEPREVNDTWCVQRQERLTVCSHGFRCSVCAPLAMVRIPISRLPPKSCLNDVL